MEKWLWTGCSLRMVLLFKGEVEGIFLAGVTAHMEMRR